MAGVNPLLNTIGEDVMGFLNEIQMKYPMAISLASGRPDESYFDIEGFSAYFNAYVEATAFSEKQEKRALLKKLGQYNKTKGFVNNLIAAYLKKDENIAANPEDILTTVGAQEALAIAVITLCDKEKDIIIVEDPSYVGITHFSLITGYSVEPVSVGPNGISPNLVVEKILNYEKIGKRVKLVYVIADFQNPTGSYMSTENRRVLLELADKYDFYILEDNAYGSFVYEGAGYPTMKALDKNNRVIYIHSFAKILYPSLRIAAMVAGQIIKNEGEEVRLSDLMARTKGYLTVNTPAVTQAILGGMLIKNNYTLKYATAEKVKSMKNKRNLVLQYMNKYLRANDDPWAENITWNIPEGGFFMTIRVPFNVDKNDVTLCAEKFRVIFTPMSFFYLKGGGYNEIRIAFSNLQTEYLQPAIERLTMYFKSKF